MNLKNYKHLTQIFLFVKVTLIMMVTKLLLKCNKSQSYLISQPIYKTITPFSDLPDTISGWGSKGLSNEKFTPLFTPNKSFSKTGMNE